MADKTDTRVSRSYIFTFNEDTDKARFHKHAKRQGRTLAGLIKYLLERDVAAVPGPPESGPTRQLAA